MNEIVHLLNPWWAGKRFEKGISRKNYIDHLVRSLVHKRVVFVVGSRRVGKTTLLKQVIDQLLSHVSPKHILYLLLDHPQLSQCSLFELLREYRSYFRLDRKEKIYLFLDEIQYMKGWEQEVKALVDTEEVKIFVSGSASTELLIKKSFLTGRVEKYTIYPLNFQEFLDFKKARVDSTEEYKYISYCEEYLEIGGYPEYVLEKDPTYFVDLVNDILYKDIIRMYDLKNPDILRDLLLMLADRTGQQSTFTKLGHVLSLKNDTIKEYIYYLKNTFLLYELSRYSTSRNKRIYAGKKYYIADNGILFHLLGRFSQSAAFEQTVLRRLIEQKKHVFFYYENQQECDFLIQDGERKELWEAKYTLPSDFDSTLQKYLRVASELNIQQITVVTMKNYQIMKHDDILVRYVPLWKILLHDLDF